LEYSTPPSTPTHGLVPLYGVLPVKNSMDIYTKHSLALIMGDKRQKMITLDLTSYEYATQMTNFSKWVREKLMEEYNKGQQTLPVFPSKTWLYCPDCYYSTNSSLGYCMQCVPKTVKMVSHKELLALEMDMQMLLQDSQ